MLFAQVQESTDVKGRLHRPFVLKQNHSVLLVPLETLIAYFAYKK
jgi:hypothetical protein